MIDTANGDKLSFFFTETYAVEQKKKQHKNTHPSVERVETFTHPRSCLYS